MPTRKSRMFVVVAVHRVIALCRVCHHGRLLPGPDWHCPECHALRSESYASRPRRQGQGRAPACVTGDEEGELNGGRYS